MRKKTNDYDDGYRYSDTPQARYDKTHTTYIGLRIEEEADADILKALEGKPKQTEIKKLVRLGMGKIRYEEKNEKKKQLQTTGKTL